MNNIVEKLKCANNNDASGYQYLVCFGPDIGHIIYCASAIYSGRIISPSMQKVFKFSIVHALLTHTLRCDGAVLKNCVERNITFRDIGEELWICTLLSLYGGDSYILFGRGYLCFRLLSFLDRCQFLWRKEYVDMSNKHRVDFVFSCVWWAERKASGEVNIVG